MTTTEAILVERLERLKTLVRTNYSEWAPVGGETIHKIPTLRTAVTLRRHTKGSEVSWQPEGCRGPTMIELDQSGVTVTLLTSTRAHRVYKVVTSGGVVKAYRLTPVPEDEGHLGFVRVDVPEEVLEAIPPTLMR